MQRESALEVLRLVEVELQEALSGTEQENLIAGILLNLRSKVDAAASQSIYAAFWDADDWAD